MRRSACISCWIALLCAVLCNATSAQTSGTKRALLIGIGKYEQLPWLSGSRNDVAIVRGILVDRYGFAPDNIRTLVDDEANRAAIIAALDELVASAGPNDTVFVHYSGHGSQVRDLDGDEPDGLDETICPVDARTEGVPDITDDELGRILGRLRANSAVVILDSCHSGTALRAAPANIQARSVPPDSRIELYDSGSTVTRGVVPAPGTEPYVLFSAAAADQQELDGPFGPDGQRLGLLTAALSRALESASGNVSPRQLLTSIEANVEKIKPIFAGYPVPEAQLEGQLEHIDLPLFSPVVQPKALATTVASAVKRPAEAPRRIFVSGEKRRLLQRAVSDESAVEWTDAIEGADAVIDCGSATACDVYGPGGAVRVASLSMPEDAEVAERLADVAVRADSIAELLSVDDTAGLVQVRMHAAGVPASQSAPIGTRGIKLTASVSNHHIRFYRDGEPRTPANSLQLEIETDTPCFLTLVSVDSAGAVTQLLPNPIQEQMRFIPDGFLQAGQVYRVPDSLEEGNRAGFHLDYAPPAGTDTVRAFCTASRRLADAVRSDIRRISDGGYGVSIKATLISSRGLTGVRPGQEDPGAWGSATITIDVAGR